MIIVHYGSSSYECSYAARTETEVILYDANHELISRISGIYGDEWDYISIENGEWSEPEEAPSEKDILNARLDQMQADLDYCLMLLEDSEA